MCVLYMKYLVWTYMTNQKIVLIGIYLKTQPLPDQIQPVIIKEKKSLKFLSMIIWSASC